MAVISRTLPTQLVNGTSFCFFLYFPLSFYTYAMFFFQLDKFKRIDSFRYGCFGCSHSNGLLDSTTETRHLHFEQTRTQLTTCSIPREKSAVLLRLRKQFKINASINCYAKKSFLLQLDHEQICVNFTIERWFPVANMSRYLPIRVYDYYAPGK